jgi:lipopolysaccharide export system protein LptA
LQKKNILFISIFLFSTTSFTKEKSIPIEIVADKLVAQEKKGASVYTGNIKITQDKLKIKGDKASIEHPNNKIKQIVIIGKPATFINFIEEDNTWVKGHANKITYNSAKKTILFEENATIAQGESNSISGSKILYDSIKQTLQARGNKQRQEQIKVIFSGEEQP